MVHLNRILKRLLKKYQQRKASDLAVEKIYLELMMRHQDSQRIDNSTLKQWLADLNQITVRSIAIRSKVIALTLMLKGLLAGMSFSEVNALFDYKRLNQEERSALEYAWNFYQIAQIKPNDLEWIDKKVSIYLERMNRELGLYGYKHLADFYNNNERKLIGFQVAHSLHIKKNSFVDLRYVPFLWPGLGRKILFKLLKFPSYLCQKSFVTLFDNGDFLVTNNYPLNYRLSTKIYVENYAEKVSFRNLEKRHNERVQTYLDQFVDRNVLTVLTRKEVEKYWSLWSDLIVNYRQYVNYVTNNDLSMVLSKRNKCRSLTIRYYIEVMKKIQ